MNEKILFHIEIMDPPSKYEKSLKRIKVDKKTGNLITKNTYYLSNNIFYGNNLHWMIQYEIINYTKDWLMPYLKDVPKIKKCEIELIYYRETEQFDLDNKTGFWMKILLDLLKTPTKKQKDKALRNNTWIRSVEALPDDTVKYVDGLIARFKPGKHRLEIKIIESEISQPELF